MNKVKYIKPADYSKFFFLDLNRPIKNNHVRKLRAKIATWGMLFNLLVIETDIFTGTMTLYIADGQHRFNACVDLGIEIPYVKIRLDSKEKIAKIIASINSGSMPWTLDDYMHAWSKIGIDSYIIIKKKRESSGIMTSALISFYSLNVSGGRSTSRFKDGEFTIPNLELSTQLISIYQECVTHMRFEHWTDSSRFADWVITNHPERDKLVNIVKNNRIKSEILQEELDRLYYHSNQ
jgi:hypothetical protein